MAYDIVIHDTAKSAVGNIIEYLDLVSGGTQVSEAFFAELVKQVGLIEANPELYGLSRDPRLAEAGYRTALVNRYIMLYYVAGETVHVSHIFHQSQDYARYVI